MPWVCIGCALSLSISRSSNTPRWNRTTSIIMGKSVSRTMQLYLLWSLLINFVGFIGERKRARSHMIVALSRFENQSIFRLWLFMRYRRAVFPWTRDRLTTVKSLSWIETGQSERRPTEESSKTNICFSEQFDDWFLSLSEMQDQFVSKGNS